MRANAILLRLISAVIMLTASIAASASRADADSLATPDPCPENVMPAGIDSMPLGRPGAREMHEILRQTESWTQQQRDSAWRHDHYWTTLLRRRSLDMKDTTVIYPKFLGFCVKVYNWADRVFNSYDPDYVEGTGKRWKARIVNDNWVDSYAMRFPESKMSMRMMSDIYSNAGAYIHYMAVSIGYSINLNHALAGKPIDQKRFEFGFNCARFNLDVTYSENTGGSYMRTFGDYKKGRLFKSYFPGLELHTFAVDLYYFFNNRKYSQGAAYNFSKIQKRRAGSFIIGLTYSDQDISLDFSTLSPTLQPYLKIDSYFLKFHYFNYCLLFGYGYNWVLNPHLLFNISALPSIGINHCYEDSADGSGNLLSLNIKGRMSLTYNLKNLFMGIQAKMDGHWYRSDKHSLFNSIETLSANVGIRF